MGCCSSVSNNKVRNNDHPIENDRTGGQRVVNSAKNRKGSKDQTEKQSQLGEKESIGKQYDILPGENTEVKKGKQSEQQETDPKQTGRFEDNNTKRDVHIAEDKVSKSWQEEEDDVDSGDSSEKEQDEIRALDPKTNDEEEDNIRNITNNQVRVIVGREEKHLEHAEETDQKQIGHFEDNNRKIVEEVQISEDKVDRGRQEEDDDDQDSFESDEDGIWSSEPKTNEVEAEEIRDSQFGIVESEQEETDQKQTGHFQDNNRKIGDEEVQISEDKADRGRQEKENDVNYEDSSEKEDDVDYEDSSEKEDDVAYEDSSEKDKEKREDYISPNVREEKEDDFTQIDQHALNAPQEVRKSVPTVVEYLLKSATSDRGKARAFFVWIADNIQYDTESYFSGDYKNVNADSVLKSGSSVCSGYANLFQEMCKLAGLSVEVISGFSKGYSYSPEKPLTPTTQTDHAWNAVLIENSWRFVECTWGAGYLDRSGKFQKRFSDFYFLTDPKHFISAHFPWKSGDLEYCNKWQLLDHPITLKQFNKMLKLEDNAMMWDISPLSHTEGVIEAHEEVDIIIKDKLERLCGTSVKFYNCKTGKSFDEYTFLRRENPKTIAVSLRPPSNGTYQLNVYGKIDQLEKSHGQLMSYVIKFSNVTTDSNPYPFNHGQMWGMSLEAFENGFQAADRYNIPTKLRSENGYIDLKLNTTRNLPTIAKIEPATKQLPGDKRRYCLVSSTDSELNILACFPVRDLYKLEVMCQRVEGDEKYHQMALFLIDCTKPADPGLPYPATYSSTQEYRCKLIEPLEGQLPANSSVTCRFQSPLVYKAMVAKTKMKQDGDEWWATVTTPGVGEKFKISGNVSDENIYYSLFEYDIV
ncbi:kyphoscoliosis peptidase-like isoform X2 [Ostrea edulis]|uniref:kyphoscoliosis peptidase-like isoform X2 n=1 Tax=Ostrea edulis TaxID=37623 RepID=UPI0024AECBC1|nr:kyphoscoliosis peptidase-like isoform X2 [Ostrea edulis]